MPTEGQASPPVLPEGPFDGRLAFRAVLQAAWSQAAACHWRELVLSDEDFADWPLGERACIDALQAWARAGRRLHLLARDFGAVQRGQARFVRWRQQWDHLIECRVLDRSATPELPSALWTPDWSMHRIDPRLHRGVSGRDAASRVALRQWLDECWQRARPGFAASTLGL